MQKIFSFALQKTQIGVTLVLTEDVYAQFSADVLHCLGWQQLLVWAYSQLLEVHAVAVKPALQGNVAHAGCKGDLEFHLCFHLKESLEF